MNKTNTQLIDGSSYLVEIIKYLRTGVVVRFLSAPDRADSADSLFDTSVMPGETAMIHLSQISAKFVDDVSKFVRIGDKYVARCVNSPKFGNQLSLLWLDLQPQDNVDSDFEED